MSQQENSESYFGDFGGQFLSNEAKEVLQELEQAYDSLKDDKEFYKTYHSLLKNYLGRETPLTYAENLSKYYGHSIYLKREDLNHTGSHKMNNALGQALLAKKMGKTKLIAETGAGQHGVATATAAALLGMSCEIYMGAVDTERQKLNVFRMQMLGAKIHAVHIGLKTLNEAVDAALEAWVKDIKNTFYLLGSAVGPYPYPMIVRDFQSVIGNECKQQLTELNVEPQHIIACVGGGSNAIGIFSAFLDDNQVKLYGIEAGGISNREGEHAAALSNGKPGILHGMKTYILTDSNGNIAPVHSISAGLDYPGVGPQHAHLHESKRVVYSSVTDEEALQALKLLTRKEGIIPALESAHALAYLEKLCPQLEGKQNIVVNISGRGDKDMYTVFEHFQGL